MTTRLPFSVYLSSQDAPLTILIRPSTELFPLAQHISVISLLQKPHGVPHPVLSRSPQNRRFSRCTQVDILSDILSNMRNTDPHRSCFCMQPYVQQTTYLCFPTAPTSLASQPALRHISCRPAKSALSAPALLAPPMRIHWGLSGLLGAKWSTGGILEAIPPLDNRSSDTTTNIHLALTEVIWFSRHRRIPKTWDAPAPR